MFRGVIKEEHGLSQYRPQVRRLHSSVLSTSAYPNFKAAMNAACTQGAGTVNNGRLSKESIRSGWVISGHLRRFVPITVGGGEAHLLADERSVVDAGNFLEQGECNFGGSARPA